MAKQNKKLAQVFHFDLHGKRDEKYKFLNENSLKSVSWNELKPDEPNYFLVNKNFEGSDDYKKGFKIDELFKINSGGIKTHRDHFVIGFDQKDLKNRISEFYDLSIDDYTIEQKFSLKDNHDFKISAVRRIGNFEKDKIQFIDYRPFDKRYCYYESNLIDRNREKVMRYFIKTENIGLVTLRQSRNGLHGTFWITTTITGKDAISSLDTCTTFPLYLYPETTVLSSPPSEGLGEARTRTPNFNPEIIQKIAQKLGLIFVPEKEPEGKVCYINNPEVRDDFKTTFAPIDLLDYIYAVLHSPTYREKYKEFLKIDFPRVPFPKAGGEAFWQLVKLGGEIRQIHLLESPTVENYITQYPIDGNNKVGKVVFENGKVYINYEKASLSGRLEGLQYFDNVPEIAWNFYIGGYQPAQKWLKDRKGRTLEFEDILHYQKIIVALTETSRLMKEIDERWVE